MLNPPRKHTAVSLYLPVDNIRAREGRSVDALFRDIFRAEPMFDGEKEGF